MYARILQGTADIDFESTFLVANWPFGTFFIGEK